MNLFKTVENKITELLLNSNSISEERKELLARFAGYISNKVKKSEVVNLIFICTHNSRRSIMAQIWAQTAAEYFEIPNLYCYSGGTEATAFNRNAVKAVKEGGFKVSKTDESNNPIYLVSYSDENEAIKCFSKVYNDNFNPQKNFAAIMTCSDADANCPVVLGADERFPIKYDDPKEYDGTNLELLKYTERFEQIGTEIIYTFSRINSWK